MEDWHDMLSQSLKLMLFVTQCNHYCLFPLTSFVCDNCLKKSNKTRKENKYAAKSKWNDDELPAHFLSTCYGSACLVAFPQAFYPFVFMVWINFSFSFNTNILRLNK